MTKILVVTYSRTGTTLRVASEIAEALSADVHEIEEVIDRRGWRGWLRGSIESLTRGLPSIQQTLHLTDYDLVILGTPVWFGSMASPMRSFLFLHAHELTQVACFCTSRSAGARSTLNEMKALCGAPDAPTFSASEGDIENDRHIDALREFTTELRRLMRMPAAA